jgi:hypothetical protein
MALSSASNRLCYSWNHSYIEFCWHCEKLWKQTTERSAVHPVFGDRWMKQAEKNRPAPEGLREKSLPRLALLLVILLVPCRTSGQTDHGNLVGVVLGESGDPIEGVSVIATSPALPGPASTMTNARGTFRLHSLPPGEYVAEFSLFGYQVQRHERISITIDGTVTLRPTLVPRFSEEVTVTAGAPLVDVTTTSIGSNLVRELITDLPVGRSLQSLLFLAPGAVDGGLPELSNSPSILGSSAAENRYIVDELDVTDPVKGISGTRLSFDFVEQVNVKSGGYEAEYGGALGGVVNLITKGGGNELHGSLFGYYSDDSLRASARVPRSAGDAETAFSEWDVGFTLGGSFIQDQLWYFVGYNPSIRESTITNDVLKGEELYQRNVLRPTATFHHFAGKLSWQIRQGSSLTATLIGDPWEIEPDHLATFFVDTPYLPTDLSGTQDSGGINWALSSNTSVGGNTLLEVKIGVHKLDSSWTPANDLPRYRDETTNGRWTDGVGRFVLFGGSSRVLSNGDSERRQARLAVSRVFRERHDVRLGAQWNRLEANNFSSSVGANPELCLAVAADFLSNASNRLAACDADGVGSDGDGLMIPANGGPGRLFLLDPAGSGSEYFGFFSSSRSIGRTDELALFVQDTWRVGEHLTFKVGLRTESTHIRGSGEKAPQESMLEREISLSLLDQIQPRVGFNWDFAGNGRSRIFGHYGRFFESIPLNINVRAFGDETGELFGFRYPRDLDGTVTLPNLGGGGFLPNPGTLQEYFVFGVGGSAADPKLGGQFLEEVVLGTEFEVMNDFAIEFKGVYRSLGRVIEDISLDRGFSYFITNPGGTYTTNPATGAELDETVFFPEPERIYRALELSARKRLVDRWQLYGSLLWSRNRGNYGGLFRQDNSQLDPNITSAFDLPSTLQGAYGLLPNDRTWQLKAYGSYHWRSRLVTGFNLSWANGTPISKLGFDVDYGGRERFVEPRGTAGRTPTISYLDLHLAYPFHLSEFTLQLIIDAFNIFDQQGVTAVDDLYTFSRDPQTDQEERLRNPFWLEPIAYQSPRRVRLGLKLEW